MLKNNCQCELCRSVWGVGACEERDKLTFVEAIILALFYTEYPSVLTLTSTKEEVELLYENN